MGSEERAHFGDVSWLWEFGDGFDLSRITGNAGWSYDISGEFGFLDGEVEFFLTERDVVGAAS